MDVGYTGGNISDRLKDDGVIVPGGKSWVRFRFGGGCGAQWGPWKIWDDGGQGIYVDGG